MQWVNTNEENGSGESERNISSENLELRVNSIPEEWTGSNRILVTKMSSDQYIPYTQVI